MNLKSGAESGWDFSSRWIVNPTSQNGSNLAYIKTNQIIPVDLNAYLCGAHKQVAKFHDLLDNPQEAAKWWEKAQTYEKAIEAVLYDSNDGIWYDYETIGKTARKQFYPSNFAPLWAGAYNTFYSKRYGDKAAKYFKNKLVSSQTLGGIPTSLVNTGEQWDLPNAWPPLQEIVILGLYSTDSIAAQELALTYAHRWIEANKLGYTNTGDMFEKYDTAVPGQYGGGGEYNVQTGFGWSNGVVLSLIEKFPTLQGNSTSTPPCVA